jgi:transcriptional pleiotropic regulator of transition state genes
MKKSKQLTNKSSLTIPKDMRAEAGFFPGMAVDMETVRDGILVKPHVPVCRFCGRPEGVKKVAQTMDVCPSCRQALRRELEQYGD